MTTPASPRLFGIHARPAGALRWLLAALPFALLVAVYLSASAARHADNPDDKLLPTPAQMADAVHTMAFTADTRTDKFLMLGDTLSSLRRLGLGLLSAAVVGLALGLNMGMFAGMRALLSPFVTFLSMIPPLAVLPILFITLGVDELAKVALIFIGVFPVITRDILGATQRIPREQITKALTLGASQLALVYRIVLPQVLPRLIEALRLSLGAAWLFLIAAEAIAADQGLGYRIFLVRRYLAMDVILPYVLWITLLGYLFDLGLRQVLKRGFRWYVAQSS
jgi:NitT/TauT family transport system permease protein